MARATGESIRTVADLGFVPLANIAVERDPMVVDWDQLDQHRVSAFAQRSRRQAVAT